MSARPCSDPECTAARARYALPLKVTRIELERNEPPSDYDKQLVRRWFGNPDHLPGIRSDEAL